MSQVIDVFVKSVRRTANRLYEKEPRLFSNSGIGCQALLDIDMPAGFTVLSAVGAELSA